MLSLRLLRMGALMLLGVVSAACSPRNGSGESAHVPAARPRRSLPPGTGGGPYPDPGGWGPERGPGGPATTFSRQQLFSHCAYLDGGEGDVLDHHNLATMYDGYLLMPWAPESGGGGISLWDVSDPCAPRRHGYGYSHQMRETHSIGFSRFGGAWAVTNAIDVQPHALMSDRGGILFWDLSDTSAPEAVGMLQLPGFFYPDAYDRVALSVFWQVPYVFVGAGNNGIFVVDATDPRHPVLVNQVRLDPVMRVGQVQAIGNLLIATSAEEARTVLLDISEPEDPQPIPGGDFVIRAVPGGPPRDAYFSTTSNGFIFYTRKEHGGGLIVYDIHDPGHPTWAGSIKSEGNGGYVFVKDGLAFAGESDFAAIYDVSRLPAIEEVQRVHLRGDLDTLSPVGNVAVLSVDEGADEDRGSAVVPWTEKPDTAPPTVTWMWPGGSGDAPGQTIPVGSRIGFSLSEPIDVKSAWEGSVRVYPTGSDPARARVNGFISAQENLVNFVPFEPLAPHTQYTVELPAGGLTDASGNALASTFTATFTTGS